MNLPSLQAIDLLKNPLELLNHIEHNISADVLSKLQDAVTQYDAGNWYNVGDDVGQVLDKLVVESTLTVVDVSSDVQNAEQFIMGLANGFFSSAVHITPACIDNTQGLAQDVEEVYKRSLRLVLCNRQA